LGFAPDVAEELSKLSPVEQARRVQQMNDDLDIGRMPDDSVTYETFRDLRNRQEASRTRKPQKR
jgi:hypothetical protein